MTGVQTCALPISASVVGQSIRIFSQSSSFGGGSSGGSSAGGTPFKIVGIMAPKGFIGSQDQDDVIYIPYTSHMKRISRRTYLSQIYVQAKDEESVVKAKADINDLLTQRHNGTVDFTVQDQADITAARTASTTADRKSTRLNSSHIPLSRMPSSA